MREELPSFRPPSLVIGPGRALVSASLIVADLLDSCLITEADYARNAVYVIPILGLITTIIRIGRSFNLHHRWSHNNSFLILY